jgi:hydroxymethylglutaryl-CoA lyase
MQQFSILVFLFLFLKNFQMRTTQNHCWISVVTLQEILEIADKSNKEVVAYLSMGFGESIRSMECEYCGWMDSEISLGVKILSLSGYRW